MVETQIKARGIRNKKVLYAMRKIPRHLFVDESLTNSAYDDNPLPISEGQTISQPYIVALMTELISPEATDRVLEIGTGSGYQTAVLAEIVREVYTIEMKSSLYERAEELLKSLGYRNINFKTGDGFFGWEKFAPYDKIIVTCAPEEIPPPLFEQLKEGAKLVIPAGGVLKKLKVAEKSRGRTEITDSIPVRFVKMTGAADSH